MDQISHLNLHQFLESDPDHRVLPIVYGAATSSSSGHYNWIYNPRASRAKFTRAEWETAVINTSLDMEVKVPRPLP
jgi:hypothetical protein